MGFHKRVCVCLCRLSCTRARAANRDVHLLRPLALYGLLPPCELGCSLVLHTTLPIPCLDTGRAPLLSPPVLLSRGAALAESRRCAHPAAGRDLVPQPFLLNAEASRVLCRTLCVTCGAGLLRRLWRAYHKLHSGCGDQQTFPSTLLGAGAPLPRLIGTERWCAGGGPVMTGPTT